MTKVLQLMFSPVKKKKKDYDLKGRKTKKPVCFTAMWSIFDSFSQWWYNLSSSYCLVCSLLCVYPLVVAAQPCVWPCDKLEQGTDP